MWSETHKFEFVVCRATFSASCLPREGGVWRAEGCHVADIDRLHRSKVLAKGPRTVAVPMFVRGRNRVPQRTGWRGRDV